MGSEVPLSCAGERDQAKVKGAIVGVMQLACVTIIEGAICSDHVHMYLSVPPKYSPAQVMKILKGKSAEYLRRDFPELAKKYWGLHIWARGYFVSTVGIDSATIQKYVKEQVDSQMREEQLALWRDDSE